jgi:hypothetical protein
MVVESGSRAEIKACVFATARLCPVAGFTYFLPGFFKAVIVLASDTTWVHIVTSDFYSSTSLDRKEWDYYAARNEIERVDTPWFDITETRRSLLGS